MDIENYIINVNFLFEERKYDDAIELSRRMLEMGMDTIEVNTHLGILYRYKGVYDKAEYHYRKAIALGARQPKVYWNTSLLLLLLKNFDEGFYFYEAGIASGHRTNLHPKISVWKGQDLTNKSLLVYNEQGLGDTLNFSRAVNFLRLKYPSARIDFEVQSALKVLFPKETWNKKRKYDYAIPLISIFNYEKEAMKEEYAFDFGFDKNTSDEIKKIGICWKGNPKHFNDKNRSLSIDDVKPLFDLNYEFVSLVQNTEVDEEKILREYDIEPLTKKSSIKDTAKIIEELDLIITCDTMIAHLAASMKKKTWIMIPTVPDWRWGIETDKSYWYESVKLFRQSKLDNWSMVIDDVKGELKC